MGRAVKEDIMQVNVGSVDRGLRIGAGALLIGLGAAGVAGAWGYIGVIPLATGVLRFCPAYKIFGFSTCPVAKR
jgi:hypothetical protein